MTEINEDIGFYKEISNNYEIRYEMYKGKDHIVVPVVMMTSDVHSGSHGPLLHLAEDLGKFPASWDGIPVSIQHPQENGNNVSANQPHIIDNQVVGQVFNTRMEEGKLKAEAWIDQDAIQRISPEALKYIQEGKPLDVSVGVFTEDEYSTGDYNGKHYEGIARNHRPDHLALLPGGTGACSWATGCGIRANTAIEDYWSDESRKAALEKRRGGGHKGPSPASGMSLSGKASTVAESASAMADEKGTADSAALAASSHEDAAKLADKDGNTAQSDFHKAEAKKYRDKQAQLKTASEGDQMQTNIGRLKYDGIESTAWSGPTLQDFGLDGRWQDLGDSDRAKVAAHYLIGTSQTGSFTDLKLPVINPKTSKLNEFALRAVISGRGSAITGVDPKEKMAAQRMAYSLLNSEFGADLSVPTTMELLIQEFLPDDTLKLFASEGVTISIYQMSYQDISEKTQAKLADLDNNKTFSYVKEVFDKYFIYCQRPKDLGMGPAMSGYGCEEGQLFRQSYIVTSDDEVEFTGEAQPVVKKVEYITQAKQGDSIMANKDEKKPCCAEKVELLIQSQQFTEADREWLMAMDEGQIDKLETLANPANKAKADKLMADAKVMMDEAKALMANSATSKEQAIQVLKEELGDQTKFLGLLPPETRATMEHGLRLYKAEREKKIGHILANTNADVYSQARLIAMSDQDLDDLARAIKAPASYAPLGPQALTNNEEILLPAGVVLDG